MLDIQYQCFTQTSAESVPVFLSKLQFIGVSRTNLKEKKPDLFTLQFHF